MNTATTNRQAPSLYPLGYSETEFKRLERQGAFLRDLTEDVLRRAGLAAGMHVLDVGCGVGDVSLLAATLVGTKSNRDGIGAVVRIESAGGKQWNTVKSGSSYCSQSDLSMTFGLGMDETVSALDVEWPSGMRQRFTNIRSNQRITITEGENTLR